MSGIKRVVLYKHGVGYFERIERVQDNQELRLSFRASEMNDLLKSLTLYDLDGGTIHSVSYDTQKPVQQLLSEVALDIPDGSGGTGLLSSVRGAQVSVAVGQTRVEGRVVGIDTQELRTAHGVAKAKLLSILDQKGSLHTFDLTDINTVSFEDEHLQKDLAFYFETLLLSTKRDVKHLCIHASGEGERSLQISYVIECPVWKTSYRVALPEQAGDRPFLQGWALIDNTQDEDWEEVELSLVAGLPISFVHDLYSPRYVQRQRVEVQREASAGPIMAQASMFGEAVAGGAYDDESMILSGSLCEEAPEAFFDAPQARRSQMSSAPVARTVTQSLGDLFEYRVDHPVTVRRNQSALVPIVTAEFHGRRVSLYNRAERLENPFSALELKNTTGFTLEGGPLVVFDGDTYAGEAMMDTLVPDEERLIPFAVDLGVEVESDNDTTHEEIHLIVAEAGVFRLESASLHTTRYHLRNKDKSVKIVILEHPITPGRTLYKTAEPSNSSRNYYRFEVSLEPQMTTTFVVCEKDPKVSHRDIRALGPDQLKVYLSRGYLSTETEQAFQEVMTLAQSMAKLRTKSAESYNKIKAISKDQERLRKNLAALGTSPDEGRLRTRYVATMEEHENAIERRRQLAEKLEAEIEKRQGELEESARRITFEKVIEPAKT